MQYRKFGKHNLNVSEMGHGLWGMGGWTDADDKQSMTALERSLELGCNFFDTAWAYGSGHSERLLGQLIRNHPDAEIIVATKVPPKNGKWPADPADKLQDAFPAQHIIDLTKRSLENLGTDSLHLQQLHVWDDAWAADPEWIEAAQRLKDEGLIKFFGLSLNRWEPWNGLKAIRTGAVDAVQVIYNIFDQAPEDELLPLCQQLDIAVIARVPFDEGSLAGQLRADSSFPEGDFRRIYFGPENLGPTVARVEALRADLPAGGALAETALRFAISHPAVHTVIPGMRRPAHVRANVDAAARGALAPSDIAMLRAHRWDRTPAAWSL